MIERSISCETSHYPAGTCGPKGDHERSCHKRFPSVLHGSVLFAVLIGIAGAHNETLPATAAYLAQLELTRATTFVDPKAKRSHTLSLHLRGAGTNEPLAGLVRITSLNDAGKPVFLDSLFERSAGWFSMGADATVKIPAGRFRVEAVHGIETVVAMAEIETSPGRDRDVTLALESIYDPDAHQLRNANTHLHLILDAHAKVGVRLRSRRDADDYLQTVGHSDGLDLVYVSYLTRPLEVYVSNEYTDADLARFSQGGTLFANGVEHRHAGGPDLRNPPLRNDPQPSISYGHVMLLDLRQRILPASIGALFSDDPTATDGVPLRHGIIEARNQGAGVIWCHGMSGLEDIPDWLAGLIHAQNIFDGDGDFDAVFHPYLNIGLKIPFSTGTDWGVWDFNRVYVKSTGPFSSRHFLSELEAGRTFITNEPFLEFTVDDAVIGDSLVLPEGRSLRVRGHVVGRSDFIRAQVVYNGKVVHETPAAKTGNHFEAVLDFSLPARDSGWLALRVPTSQRYSLRTKYSGPGVNILGKAIFAHTSPVYLTVAGRPTFDQGSLDHLLLQVRLARKLINDSGKFANPAERQAILRIYDEAESTLVHLGETKGRR